MARCVVFIEDMQTWQSGIVTKINKISSEYLVELVDVKTRAFAVLYAEYGDRIVK